jgi:hypothetical protein
MRIVALRRTVRRLARAAGLRAMPSPPPRYVLTVPLRRCRTLGALAFPCGRAEVNPMAATLRAYAAGEERSYEGSPLQRYFERWQPATVAEAVGLDPAAASAQLQAPTTGDVPPLPWSPEAPSRAHERHQREGFQQAAARAGVIGQDLVGSLYYGPVSDAFGAATFERLVGIFESIRREGYVPGGSDRPHLRGLLFLRDGDYRVLITSGKHRIAALSALEVDLVPVEFGATPPIVVDRDDVERWPAVVTGVYTREEALDVFDRVFVAEQPTGVHRSGEPGRS